MCPRYFHGRKRDRSYPFDTYYDRRMCGAEEGPISCDSVITCPECLALLPELEGAFPVLDGKL